MACHARKTACGLQPVTAGGVWTAVDSWCLGGLGIAVQLSPVSPGKPAAPGADTHKAASYPVICFHLFTTGCLTWSSELYFLPPMKRFSSFLLQAQGGHNGAIRKIIVAPHQPRSEPSRQTAAFGCRVTIITPLKLPRW